MPMPTLAGWTRTWLSEIWFRTAVNIIVTTTATWYGRGHLLDLGRALNFPGFQVTDLGALATEDGVDVLRGSVSGKHQTEAGIVNARCWDDDVSMRFPPSSRPASLVSLRQTVHHERPRAS
ncbi:hypothetical protein BKA70DRAFT_1450516 [Coprinopsis sp. MPI-PUGE-AT-0042]|nr:hypothetical protein BKA70DRAFT_1450516 [Coprinopsis sp. MPI-PUGE-AT-0042]